MTPGTGAPGTGTQAAGTGSPLRVSLDDPQRLRLLEPPGGRSRIVLDTDAANEIDDQFAIAYALLSGERIDVAAIYAAPFESPWRGTRDAEDGMERSYAEIERVVDHLRPPARPPILKGSRRWLPGPADPVRSEAAADLIDRARAEPGVLYVVAIGAPTNVASAVLLAPDIADRLVVVWLGGNPVFWHRAVEFNVYQDMHASRVLLDSGVALVHVPCLTVTEQLLTTQPEIDKYVRPCGAIGRYLADIYAAYYADHFARSKEIWDIGPVAWLVNPEWVDTAVIHSPVLGSAGTWSHDDARHLIREARSVNRDGIFGDFFRKLARG